MKYCPRCGRTYADETFSFCLEDGSLLSAPSQPAAIEASSDPDATLVLSATVYSQTSPTLKIPERAGEPIETIVIDEPVITININREYQPNMSADDLYNVTRSAWKLRKERADRARYAFALYRGTILEVYEIDRWVAGGTTSNQFWQDRLKRRGDVHHPAQYAGRYEFVGKVAPEHIRKKYVGKRMPVAQAQNPIRYFNC